MRVKISWNVYSNLILVFTKKGLIYNIVVSTVVLWPLFSFYSWDESKQFPSHPFLVLRISLVCIFLFISTTCDGRKNFYTQNRNAWNLFKFSCVLRNVRERIITMFRCDEKMPLYTMWTNAQNIFIKMWDSILVCVLILLWYNYIIIESCFT